MQKTILIITTLVLFGAASINAYAQDTETKKSGNTSTIDAWREALPGKEEPYTDPSAAENKNNVEETAADIERKVMSLEQNLMDAYKQRNSETLKTILADDFMPAGANIKVAKPNKNTYISWALKNSELSAYTIEKISVRVYGTTALATVNYKKQTTAADTTSEKPLTATDVWVKNGTEWQLVSHHLSPSPEVVNR